MKRYRPAPQVTFRWVERGMKKWHPSPSLSPKGKGMGKGVKIASKKAPPSGRLPSLPGGGNGVNEAIRGVLRCGSTQGRSMASPLAKAKERPSSKVLCFFLPEWEKAYTTLVRKSISLEVALFQEGGEILDVGEVEGGSRVPFQALLKNTPSEGKRKRRQPADMKCHVPWPKNRN